MIYVIHVPGCVMPEWCEYLCFVKFKCMCDLGRPELSRATGVGRYKFCIFESKTCMYTCSMITSQTLMNVTLLWMTVMRTQTVLIQWEAMNVCVMLAIQQMEQTAQVKTMGEVSVSAYLSI